VNYNNIFCCVICLLLLFSCNERTTSSDANAKTIDTSSLNENKGAMTIVEFEAFSVEGKDSLGAHLDRINTILQSDEFDFKAFETKEVEFTKYQLYFNKIISQARNYSNTEYRERYDSLYLVFTRELLPKYQLMSAFMKHKKIKPLKVRDPEQHKIIATEIEDQLKSDKLYFK